MSAHLQQIQTAIAALESQRALLGDAVVDAAVAPLRAKLAAQNTAAAETEQQLKQLSILFLDVVGSTTLSQRLDPEEISAVMDTALARGTQIVQAHQGKVLQYAGDNILAAFGADEAREDDTERAVHCGLALLELGRALGDDVQAAHAHDGFNFRVGIHTGGVLLGGGVDAEGTIRGIAVNIAARMEQTAPAGALRISHDTYAHVRGLFEVQVQEPLAVKGVDEPVQSYLVSRAKPRSFRIVTRGIEGVTTKMIGRDAQLEQLQDAFERLFAERRLAAVTVVAEAGLGKSRLLNEFESWAETRPESFFVFRGRATPHTQAQPFGLLRDILTWRFQIADDDTIAAARAKLEAGITPLFLHDDGLDLAEGHAHLLGHLIGIEYRDSRHIKGILHDPKQIRTRALHAAAQLFRRVSASAGSPVVLQLEDLHWADNESLDFLNYLAEVNRDVALLILAFTRPTLFERRTDWMDVEGFHQRIELRPLDKTDGRQLASELLKKLPEIPAALRDLITGGAEGNPFYMEELVKMLIDRGAIKTGAEHWTLDADKLLVTQVPPTLTGVLQARLDSLPAPERLTLQEASVIGQVFWDQPLIALDQQATETLPALVKRQLTMPKADATEDSLREYAFKHAILHQVTYGTVLKRTKRELHGRLAHWFSRLTGLRANDFLGLTAEHYEQAGDDAHAAEYHARAAEHAATRYAHDGVLAHAQRALALLGRLRDVATDHATDAGAYRLRARLLEVRESTLNFQGRRPEQRADIDALDQLADALDDDGLRAIAAHRRSAMATNTADWATGEAIARRGAALAQRAGDGELRLRCLRTVATALAWQGDWRAGQALAHEVLTQARTLGLLDVQAHSLNILGVMAATRQGDLVAALELFEQTLAINRQSGDRRYEAIILGNIGRLWLDMGALAQARRFMEEGLRMMRAHGDRHSECFVMCGLSGLALWQGDDAGALALACASRDMALAVEARDTQAEALVHLGGAELALARHAAAKHAFEQAHALALAVKRACQHDATAGLARVALAQGDVDAALLPVHALLAHAANVGSFDGVINPRLLEFTCHQVLAAAGDPRAAEWLQRAHDNLQAMAERISDAALRQGFLTNIPYHREIVAAWAAQRAQGVAGSYNSEV